MKKILTVVLCLLLLAGCKTNANVSDYEDKYYDMVEAINERDEFLSDPSYFSIASEIAPISSGEYSFFLVFDKPKVAMYDIEIIAIEKGIDYSNTMAANIGVLDSAEYNMIPNQANPSLGFYEGISISGVTSSPDPTLYVLIQWHSRDLSTVFREFYKLEIS